MSYLSTRAPGVYVQELQSGARTIVGGATSITAFVGGAARGPLQTPTSISGFGEYERVFGGLHRDSMMSQMVRHFFANRGGQALIVRVANAGAGMTLTADVGITGDVTVVGFEVVVSNIVGDTFDLEIRGIDADGESVAAASGTANVDLAAGPEATIEAIAGAGGALVAVTMPATAPALPPVGVFGAREAVDGTLSLVLGPAPAAAGVRLPSPGTDLVLHATDPGAWGNRLTASVSTTDAPPGTFHLTLSERDRAGNVAHQESHLAVSADDTSARYLPRVLERRSRMARVIGASFGAPAVTAAPIAFGGGSDGTPPTPDEILGSDAEPRAGMYALRHADLFNILCLPRSSWDTTDAADRAFWQSAMTFVESERAFLLVDPPSDWTNAAQATAGALSFAVRSDNAAMVFPQVRIPDPLEEGRPSAFPPAGVVAGIMARTDAQRGIWKAPAGIDASARGVIETVVPLTDTQQGALNQAGIDAFRTFAVYGTVLWGARTLSGADVMASDWKYVPVRRLALYIQQNLQRGTQWAVFEPNGLALWAQLRLSIGGFMHGLFRQGAFAGTSKAEAYSVECSAQTTTPDDINRGVVNVLVRFAPLRPAEFVVLKIQQIVSQAG